MEKTIFYLSTCDTCKRIIKECGIDDSFRFVDIKFQQMTSEEVDQMKNMKGSYEALFSKRSRKYKAMGLGEKDLQEEDFRKLILEEYTFLQRPVVIIGDQIFVGNSPKNVAALQEYLAKN